MSGLPTFVFQKMLLGFFIYAFCPPKMPQGRRGGGISIMIGERSRFFFFLQKNQIIIYHPYHRLTKIFKRCPFSAIYAQYFEKCPYAHRKKQMLLVFEKCCFCQKEHLKMLFVSPAGLQNYFSTRMLVSISKDASALSEDAHFFQYSRVHLHTNLNYQGGNLGFFKILT